MDSFCGNLTDESDCSSELSSFKYEMYYIDPEIESYVTLKKFLGQINVTGL